MYKSKLHYKINKISNYINYYGMINKLKMYKSKLHYKISKISRTYNNSIINQSNGSVYIGQLKNGLPDCKGIMTKYNGIIYEGEFDSGKFHGYGTMKFTNGNIYRGYFVDNQRQGYGILIDKNNRLIFDGEWYNNSTTNGTIYYSEKNNLYRKYKLWFTKWIW